VITLAIVDLPAPVCPMNATRSPGLIFRSTPRRDGFVVPRYCRVAPTSSTEPSRPLPNSSADGGVGTETSSASIVWIRRTPVLARW